MTPSSFCLPSFNLVQVLTDAYRQISHFHIAQEGRSLT